MEKPNRAERRRNRFGGGRATEHGGWPTHQPNPVFTGDGAEHETEPATPATKPSAKAEAEAGVETKGGAAPDENAEQTKD
jgi:hypothetical protein